MASTKMQSEGPTESDMIVLDGKKLVGSGCFNQTFQKKMGFPDFYGSNMNAWIDCMSYIDDPEAGMTRVRVPKGGVLTLLVQNAGYLRSADRAQYDALIECAAFVNFRRIDGGDKSVLALAFHD